mmetsp:Transcript_37644/g.116296  ORF Transcript_37644/g.116296 Transcript_37644/m.116296 type:complete len:259 (-) Transcript_37644:246-1022(-)
MVSGGASAASLGMGRALPMSRASCRRRHLRVPKDCRRGSSFKARASPCRVMNNESVASTEARPPSSRAATQRSKYTRNCSGSAVSRAVHNNATRRTLECRHSPVSSCSIRSSIVMPIPPATRATSGVVPSGTLSDPYGPCVINARYLCANRSSAGGPAVLAAGSGPLIATDVISPPAPSVGNAGDMAAHSLDVQVSGPMLFTTSVASRVAASYQATEKGCVLRRGPAARQPTYRNCPASGSASLVASVRTTRRPQPES